MRGHDAGSLTCAAAWHCPTAGVVRACGSDGRTALLVGAGLGQIGEFSFLLLSHAKRLRLMPKRMYLLMLGTTALSLLLTPLQWRLALALSGAGRLAPSPLEDSPKRRALSVTSDPVEATAAAGLLPPDSTPSKRE